MSNVKFTVLVNVAAGTVTFTDDFTDWTDVDGVPNDLTIYLRGENKTTYVIKKVITDAGVISSFQNAGIIYTYLELFGVATLLDNFYKVEIVANEGETNQMLSDAMSIGFTYEVAELIHNNMLGVNVPIEDLQTSLTLGMMPQSLELLQTLSSEAAYSYDRENKWRKIYNYLITVVNDLSY